MTKGCLALLIFIHSLFGWANQPVGFLWYTKEVSKKKVPLKKPSGISFNQLSFTERDAVLRFYTMEALHKARHTNKIEDMRVFLSLQDYWLSESTKFKQLFQKTMLAYPQYDYAVTHPTSNLGAKVTEEVRLARQIEILTQLSKSHGFMFFYRGKSPYDVKQIPIVVDFCKRFHLSLMSVSVDGVISPELPHSRIDQGQANHLGFRYFPALLLVNPKTQSISPVAYGLITQDVLMERINQVVSQFRGESS